MAALNFPNSPSVNDIHTENGVSFKWNGTIWKKVGASYLDTTNLNVTGIGTFAGNVFINGVLTYEDVKNVDSVGIVTARTGIHIDDSITHIGDTNTKIRFPANDTFSVETAGQQNVQVNGTRVLLKSPSGTDTTVRLQHQGNSGYGDIILDRSVNAFIISNDPSNASSNQSYFSVKNKGVENLRITSEGYVRIGGNEGNYPLVVIDESNRTTTADTQLHLYAKHDGSGTTGVGFGGGIRFWGDRASGNVEQNMGRIMCIADVNSGTTLSSAFTFETGVAGVLGEKVRITSAGRLGIGEASPDHICHIKGSTPILAVESSSWSSGVSAALRLSYTDGNAREIRGHYDHGLQFFLNQGEALRIDTNNKLQMGAINGNTQWGQDWLNIESGGDGGISIGRLEGGSPTNGQILGSYSFQSAIGSQNAGSAEAKIQAVAAENMSGSTAATNMLFYTKASGTGPGSSATERLRITSDGHMGLGITPSAWATNGDFRGLQVGSGTALYGRLGGDADRGGVSVNYYHTGSAEKYIAAGNANNLYMVDGEFVFKRAASGSANGTITWDTRCKINTEFGVKAENTCKAWLCYRGENGQEGILDDYNVATVSDESTGTFAVTFSRNLTQHSNGKYSLTFGSHNWSPCMLIAGVAYTSSHGSNNPWWGMEDNFVRIHTMRSDSNTLVDAEVFFMAVHGDTGDV